MRYRGPDGPNNDDPDRTQPRRTGIVAQTSIVRPDRSDAQGDAGFHRFRHGAFDITVLSDGYISIPSETVVLDATPVQRDAVLRRLAAHAGLIDVATNIPLIRTCDDVIIVDIGAGGKYQTTDGRLVGNLAACGIHPASVTKVVFTHAHPDPHLGDTQRRRQPPLPQCHLLRRHGRVGVLDG